MPYNFSNLQSIRKCFIWTAVGRTRNRRARGGVLRIWEKWRWNSRATGDGALQRPSVRVPPEDGIVVEQEVESAVSNECLTSDDG
jgi:hypothetical protein